MDVSEKVEKKIAEKFQFMFYVKYGAGKSFMRYFGREKTCRGRRNAFNLIHLDIEATNLFFKKFLVLIFSIFTLRIVLSFIILSYNQRYFFFTLNKKKRGK